MTHYHDLFWSNDYSSGIDSFLQNLEKGQAENQSSLDYFVRYTELIDLQSEKFLQICSYQEKYLDSQGQSKLIDSKIGSVTEITDKQSLIAKRQASAQQTAVSKIQSDVILPLKDFIDDFKSFQAHSKKELNASFKEYKKSLQNTNSLKSKFEAKSRLFEDITITPEAPSLPEKDETKKLPPPPEVVQREETEEHLEVQEDPIFKFPLVIGEITFDSVDVLRETLAAMIEEIPIKRRMIPIPGMNNEYYRSSDFAYWVRSNFTKEDTTRKIEKFGQDMINLGLVSNWNKLSQNLFVSDPSYYYEFTDLARYTSRFDEEQEKREQQKEFAVAAAATALAASGNTPSPLTAPSNMWSGLKNKFSNTKDITVFKEQLEQIRSSYFSSLNESIDSKSALESKISTFTKKSEQYQKNRITLLHKIHGLFNERILQSQNSYLAELETLQTSLNQYELESVNLELLQSVPNDKSGWYWPVSDTKFVDYSNRTTSVELFETDIVNLDIDEANEDPKTKSVPLFILQLITHLNEESNIGEYWAKGIDIAVAHKIKKDVLNQLFLLANSVESNSFKIKTIVEYFFKRYETGEIVTFLKYWLLELPDSLIPFTVFDYLLHLYQQEETHEAKLNVIGSIPRQNLASLLLLVEHLQANFSSPVEQLQDHPGLPFVYLLARPSVTKSTFLSRESSGILEKLLVDLFNKESQDSLYQKLDLLENRHQEKLKRAEVSINEFKSHRRQESELSVNVSNTSGSSKQSPTSSGGLKPFKTHSPSASPISSPRQSRSNSGTHNIKPNLLSPTSLKRPSDSIGKRLSRNLDPKLIPDIKVNDDSQEEENEIKTDVVKEIEVEIEADSEKKVESEDS